MSVEVRKNPVRVAAGTTVNAVANTAGEQIGASQLLDWLLKGYLFTGGSVLMDATDPATVSTQADTSPTISLQSPAGTDTIVLPLRVTAGITDDGSGTSSVSLVWTKSTQQCIVKLSLSGTDLEISNNFAPYPQVVSKCTMLHGVTSLALTAADSIVIAHAQIADAGLTTGLIQANDRFDYSFAHNPIVLTEGAALLLHGYSGSGTGRVRVVFTWAELPRDVYIS